LYYYRHSSRAGEGARRVPDAHTGAYETRHAMDILPDQSPNGRRLRMLTYFDRWNPERDARQAIR